jgi:Zn-dependent protease with chaperone function
LPKTPVGGRAADGIVIVMRESVLMVGFVVALSLVAPRGLHRAEWVQRAPRLAIAVWLCLGAAAMGAVLAAGLVAALALPPVNHGVADLLRACLHRYEVELPLSSGTIVGAVGALIALTLPAWVAGRMTGLLRSRARTRRRHLAMLALAVPVPHAEVVVLEHPQPALYCVPGRGSRVVVTTAAQRLLGRDELRAALDHERGHLVGRHHVWIGLADGMAAALPFPLFRDCRVAVRWLAELAADDHAVRLHAPDTLALAIAVVAAARAPASALGIGEGALERLRRLQNPPGRLGPRGRLLAGLAMALVFAVPVLTTGWALSHTVANDLCVAVPALR